MTQFVVGGASKRGWTTWTTGVGDMRVAAIVPVVMDLLNLLPNAAHFWAALGGWTFEFEDYVAAVRYAHNCCLIRHLLTQS